MTNLDFKKQISALKLLHYFLIAILISSIVVLVYHHYFDFAILLAMLMSFGYTICFFLENYKKLKIQKNISKYVSRNVMKKVLQNESCELGGQKKIITVMFVDIRDFTTISESLQPEEASCILNWFFNNSVPIVEKYNGVVNKFIGDALMAVFGDDDTGENHAKNAVLCSYEILQQMKAHQKVIESGHEFILKIGIGVNTGEAFVGNIGTEDHMEYTAIGDAINLASRIESHNKLYNTKFLISEYTFEQVKNFVDTIKISSVLVRGRAEPVNIYEVIDILKDDGKR